MPSVSPHPGTRCATAVGDVGAALVYRGHLWLAAGDAGLVAFAIE
jgi:hypothetical protein